MGLTPLVPIKIAGLTPLVPIKIAGLTPFPDSYRDPLSRSERGKGHSDKDLQASRPLPIAIGTPSPGVRGGRSQLIIVLYY